MGSCVLVGVSQIPNSGIHQRFVELLQYLRQTERIRAFQKRRANPIEFKIKNHDQVVRGISESLVQTQVISN